MSYRLLDSNGNYMEINGMHKGTIVSPYVYNGMELYNENYIASNRAPFYYSSWYGGSRRVKIGSSYYYPSSTTKYYSTVAYEATEVTITGAYSSSSYKDYEVYKDGNLVASGSFTSSEADIYTCEKEANTSIIISGEWDSTNSKFIYNITTNATINREESYEWDNGVQKTTAFTKNGTRAGYGSSNVCGVTVPTAEEVRTAIPLDDRDIISISYSTKFTITNGHSGSTSMTYYYRTSYESSGSMITTLPGSSFAYSSALSSGKSYSFSRSGSSYLGNTYYIYYHASNWSSGQYHSLSISNANSYENPTTVVTATVKYRYVNEVRTMVINVTRTNNYTLPKYTLENLVSTVGAGAGTVTISKFVYHVKVVDNFVSGTHYFKIFEGTTEKGSYGTLSGAGNSTIRNITYTADMTNTLVVKYSSTSTGTYSANNYMAFSPTDGDNYITITYTWEPPA